MLNQHKGNAARAVTGAATGFSLSSGLAFGGRVWTARYDDATTASTSSP